MKEELINLFPETNREDAVHLHKRMKACDSFKEVDSILEEANKIMGGFGVAAVPGNEWMKYYLDICLLYINMGDTYSKTLLYDTVKEKFLIGSWGDFVESHPRRFKNK